MLGGLRQASLALTLTLQASAVEPATQDSRPVVSTIDAGASDDQADIALVNRALGDADVAAREDAVRRLPEVARPLALDALQRAMFDGEARVRSAAIDALVDLGGDVASALVAAAVVDPAPSVREDAVFALGRMGGLHAPAALDTALGDADPTVREAARAARAAAGRPPGQ